MNNESELISAGLRSSKLRRRFLMAGVAGLAVLGPMLGVSFLGDTGTATPSITGSSASSLVYIGTMPCGTSSTSIFGPSASTQTSAPTATLEYGSSATYDSTTCSSSTPTVTDSTKNYPTWSPAADSAGQVTHGDIALVDATGVASSTDVIVNLYLTNLQSLAADYSSFAFPVDVYSCTPSTTAGSGCGSTAAPWTAVTGIAGNYLTNTAGYYSFSLPGGDYYDITFKTGGEFYCISTTASTGSLSPTYLVTASVA